MTGSKVGDTHPSAPASAAHEIELLEHLDGSLSWCIRAGHFGYRHPARYTSPDDALLEALAHVKANFPGLYFETVCRDEVPPST